MSNLCSSHSNTYCRFNKVNLCFSLQSEANFLFLCVRLYVHLTRLSQLLLGWSSMVTFHGLIRWKRLLVCSLCFPPSAAALPSALFGHGVCVCVCVCGWVSGKCSHLLTRPSQTNKWCWKLIPRQRIFSYDQLQQLTEQVIKVPIIALYVLLKRWHMKQSIN